MPGATVTLMNTALGTMFTTITDGQGLYSFPKLPVGRYDLTSDLDGFKPQKRAGIAVDADSRAADRRHARGGRAERDRHRHRQRRPRRDDVDAARRGRPGGDDDDAVAERPQLHGPAADSAGRHSDRRRCRPNSSSWPASPAPVAPSGELNPGNVSISGQREIGQRLLRQRQRRAGADERRHRRSCPNLDSIDQFRVLTNNFDPRIRQLQRRHRQRRHQVGQRHVPRQRVRVLPQHGARRAATTSRPSAPSSSRISRAARSAAR